MLHIVSTAERPDLATISGTWRWEAFLNDEASLAEVLSLDRNAATCGQPMPAVLVLLKDDQPLGMSTLCRDDLPGREDLNPWLAGVYVDPPHRGQGHAPLLVKAIEDRAREAGIERLYLYTSAAEGLYRKLGWSRLEAFERDGEAYVIMQKQLIAG